MFFLTHIYYATKVDSALDTLTVIGSILPDLALTSIISWNAMHKKAEIEAFSSFVKATDSTFLPLLLGIQYHNTVDVLSHIRYRDTIGYAYDNISPQLITLLTQAFSIDEKLARRKGHNFIESGVEMHTLADSPDLPSILARAVASIDTNTLANLLASFYKLNTEKMRSSLDTYFSIATKYDLHENNDWLLLWSEISKMQLGRQADIEKVKEALQLSFEITKDTYKEFLSTAVAVSEPELQDSN